MKPKDWKNRNEQPKQRAEIAPNASETIKETVKEIVEETKNDLPNAEVIDIEKFLNVRSTPKVERGNIIGMLTNGTKIIVVDKKPVTDQEKNEWYKIKVLDPELDGYAMKKFIKVI